MNSDLWRARLVLGVGILALTSGCKKHGQSGVVSPPMTTSTTAPVTRPTTRPTAVLWIDGVSFRFPPALLVLSPQGDGLSATLCSDDPPAAIRTGYHGNSFMIQMNLDVTSADDLDGYVWKSVMNNTADVVSNTGVFLNGTARQLQPTSLSVSFHTRGGDLVADVDGQFQSLESQNPAAQRKSASVGGRLYIDVINRP